MNKQHTNFTRAVELPEAGVVEFEAWEKAKFVGVAPLYYNGKATAPHLIFEDCPTLQQVTYRFLVLQGEAAVPLEERWVVMGYTWPTRKSFGTLFISPTPTPRDKPTEPRKTTMERGGPHEVEVEDHEEGQHVEAMAP